VVGVIDVPTSRFGWLARPRVAAGIAGAALLLAGLGAGAVAWVASWSWVLGVLPFALILLVFPDGHPRWAWTRAMVWAQVGLTVLTAAGVSSGIDMALALAGRLAGDAMAQAIQLGIEYDPQPPYHAGSPGKAPREIVAALRANPDSVLR
jgi:hypothetical protein